MGLSLIFETLHKRRRALFAFEVAIKKPVLVVGQL
jgi:hypothetical protein